MYGAVPPQTLTNALVPWTVLRLHRFHAIIAIISTFLICYLLMFSLSSKSKIQSRLAVSESAYQLYVQKRNTKVGLNISKLNPWPESGEMIFFFDYFLPAFTCPHTIQRIGRLGDGGKWVCGFELYEISRTDIHPPCILYSFGVAGESSFEAEFLERTNCLIYAYDASVSKMGPQIAAGEPRVKFSSVYIKNEEDKSHKRKLATIMKENGHKWIDIMKMDIEGGEFDVLEGIVKEFETLPFGQLQLEIHVDQKGTLFPRLYKLWEQLEAKGLRAFKNEVNHWACAVKKQKPNLMEYSFININANHRITK